MLKIKYSVILIILFGSLNCFGQLSLGIVYDKSGQVIETDNYNKTKKTFQYDELGNRISMVVSSPNNQPPLANAGPDQSVNEGDKVTLDGSGSYDPDGDELTYLWTAPQGIVLSLNTAQKPTFTAPEVSKDTILLFVLVVNDGVLNSQPDTVRITVKDINAGIIQTFYGSAQNDGGNRILSIGDGTYMSVGSYNSASFIMKTNVLGDTIWRKTFGSDQTFNDVIKTNDGNYIAVGRCGNCGNNRDEGIIYKFDPSGNIIWSNTSFVGSDVVIFFKIANTSDNGYILTGTTTNTDAWLDVILLKLSSTGTTEWVKYFGRNLDDTAYDVKQTSDGGYIIAGHSGQWNTPVMWIIKTDSLGNKIWDKTHGGSGCHVNTCAQDQAKSIEIDTDGGYLIFGHRWIDAGRKLDAVILKLDTDGNLIWEKIYGTNQDDYFFEHQKLDNGGFIIAGNIGQHQVGNSYDGKLFIVDNQFELVDSFSVGGAYNDALQSISALNDSTFAAIGRSNSMSQTVTDIWILNFDKVISSPTSNQAPIANAGPDQTVNEGDMVTLYASGSSDPDGDQLTYLWTAPQGITLSSNISEKPSFTALQVTNDTNFTFTLVVNDGYSNSIADNVIVTVKNVETAQYFTTIWTGNGTDHMNFNIVTAKIDGIDLEPGDEIGLFDDNLCVGAGVLTSTASSTNSFSMVASANDGSSNGYTAGNNIVYKLYDRSADKEFTNIEATYHNDMPDWVTDGKYQINGTTVVELAASSNITQHIVLNTGWNIISSTVIPSDLNLKNILQPLIDSGKLRKVMDESGKSVENLGIFGGWINNIGNLSATKGYKVNVTSECSLSVEGAPVSMPLTVALNTGWNIVSFPASGNQDGKTAFQSLIDAGKVKKVMDEAGKTIENLGIFGGWQNSIGDLKPGKGYKVNVSSACELVISNDLSKSALIVPEMLASAYFKPVFEGNGTDHMNINLVKLAESGIMEGDQVGVFDGETCVGSATVSAGQLNQDYISIPASMNDGLQAKPNGYTQGNAIKLRIFRNGEETDLNFDLINGYSRFAQGESMIASANINTDMTLTRESEITVKCYPVPSCQTVNIDLGIANPMHVNVSVYDALGRIVKTLYDGMAEGELKLQWQGDKMHGNRVNPGIYFCRINEMVMKIVLK